ncbi:MAG: TRAM domain-containing protein [Candidatus Marinimicrobia bacterium]|nr:TRAM domain-containing protein [Candidatus Neomarinimicrobiota bacterium]
MLNPSAIRFPPRSSRNGWKRSCSLQQEISLEHNRALTGTTQRVLIDAYDAVSHDSYGRSYRDSPDIDNRVIIPGKYRPGTFYDVSITDALEHDLLGEVAGRKP